MTEQERKAIRAIIKAFNVRRNRFGKLDGDFASSSDMNEVARALPLPHGGVDNVDQAMMILQCLIGEKPTSIE